MFLAEDPAVGEGRGEGVLFGVVQPLVVAVLRGRTAQVVGFGVVVVVAAAQLGRSGDVQLQTLDDLPVEVEVGVGHQVGDLLVVLGDVGHGVAAGEVDPFGDRGERAVGIVDAHVGNGDPRVGLRVGVAAQAGQIDARPDGDGLVHLVVYVQAGRDAFPVVVLLDAVLTFVGAREVVAELLAAAGDRKVVALFHAVAVDFVVPVGVGEFRGVAPERIVLAELLLHADVVGGAQQVVAVGHAADADPAGEGDLRLGVVAALLGGDEHHASGGPRTVDGGRARVLDDLDGGDVVQVVVAVVVHGHAVDDEERVQSVDRTHTEDHDVGAAARFAVGLGDHDARHLALEGFGDRPGRELLDVVGLDGGDRTRQVGFLLGAVAHHDHVLHLFGLLFQYDLQPFPVQDGQFQAFVAEEGDEQGGAGGYREPEGTLFVGERADRGGVAHDDGGAGERIALGVRYGSRDGAAGRLVFFCRGGPGGHPVCQCGQ